MVSWNRGNLYCTTFGVYKYDNTEKCMTPKDSPMGNSRLFNFILPVQKLQFRIASFMSFFYKFTVVFL